MGFRAYLSPKALIFDGCRSLECPVSPLSASPFPAIPQTRWLLPRKKEGAAPSIKSRDTFKFMTVVLHDN